jgi:GNAT superfamily N-acetyltransferase
MDDAACEVRLRSGDAVWIRPIRASDAVELQRAFALMSEASQYRRFLTGTPRLTDSQAAYFTAVDHVDHEAYVAHSPEDETWIIGVARFIRYESDPDDAELAVTVADSWHGRGLGTALLRVLTGMTDETVSGEMARGLVVLAPPS